MADWRDPRSKTSVKYNPHLWSEAQLQDAFVVRLTELATILERLRSTPPGRTPQHLLVTGHRGMGKTTLLRRVAIAVKNDPDLSRAWLPLTFPEEQYTVATLAEFWRNVLDALADALEEEGAPQTELLRLDAEAARIEHLPQKEQEPAVLELLDAWIKAQHRRLLLLIDSTDLLFASLGGSALAPGKKSGKKKESAASATPLWRLRKTLTHYPGVFWLGASYQALEAEGQYNAAFHDFFEIMELIPLSVEEMSQAMLALAGIFGVAGKPPGEAATIEMTRRLAAQPGRLKALRAITGGNPRTTVILYDLIVSGSEQDVDLQADLAGLLDMMTPLYKARMEALADQPRKLLAHLMEQWTPVSSGDLAKVAGIPATTVSGQLTRLEAEGLVEKARLAGTRRSGYQVSERLFNIWYLMRYTSRRVRQRLAWLVEFMRLWYSAEELRSLAVDRVRAHTEGRLAASGHLEQSLAMAMAMALSDDCCERNQLELSVFATASRLARQHQKSLAEAFPGLFDLDGVDRPFLGADDYLRRFHALDEQLKRCPHVPEERMQEWIEAVKGGILLPLAVKEILAEKCGELSAAQQVAVMQASSNEREVLQGIYESGVDTVRSAVIKGDFFPDYPEPEFAYRQAVACFGYDAKAMAFCGAIMSQMHHYRWAEAAYRKAIELAQDDAMPWRNLGALLGEGLGRYEEAEAAYRKAIVLDPEDATLWNTLGKLLGKDLGRYDEAEATLRKAIELDQEDAMPWNNLGNLLGGSLDRYEEAEAAYRKAIELDPEYATPWNNLGNLLGEDLDRYEEAEAAYRKAIELDSKDAMPWNNLGIMLGRVTERYDEAEVAFRKAIDLAPEDAMPWSNLGILLGRAIERYDEAEAAYRKAIELDPEDAGCWNNLGNLLGEDSDRHEEAEAAYRKAIELDPEDAGCWNNLGNLLREDPDRYEEAEAAYRKAIELAPEAGYWSNLGNLLGEDQGRRKEAEVAFRKAIELAPEDAGHWSNLGNLLREDQGRREEAEVVFRKAIEMDPQQPVIMANLARLMVSLHRHEEANVFYRLSISLATQRAGERSDGTVYQEVLLQAHLWLRNHDAAQQALDQLAREASQDEAIALFRLREQAQECHSIGRARELGELMERSSHADFLRPMALALKAAGGVADALYGLPPELRTMAEVVLAGLTGNRNLKEGDS